MIGELIRDKCKDIRQQQDNLMMAAYIEWIMRQEECTQEEAIRIFHEDPAARIGWKMKLYGISKLATKKGRQKFRDTQLTNEEREIWDSPERPDNIARLMAETTKETIKQGRVLVKEKFKRARHGAEDTGLLVRDSGRLLYDPDRDPSGYDLSYRGRGRDLYITHRRRHCNHRPYRRLLHQAPRTHRGIRAEG